MDTAVAGQMLGRHAMKTCSWDNLSILVCGTWFPSFCPAMMTLVFASPALA